MTTETTLTAMKQSSVAFNLDRYTGALDVACTACGAHRGWPCLLPGGDSMPGSPPLPRPVGGADREGQVMTFRCMGGCGRNVDRSGYCEHCAAFRRLLADHHDRLRSSESEEEPGS